MTVNTVYCPALQAAASQESYGPPLHAKNLRVSSFGSQGPRRSAHQNTWAEFQTILQMSKHELMLAQKFTDGPGKSFALPGDQAAKQVCSNPLRPWHPCDKSNISLLSAVFRARRSLKHLNVTCLFLGHAFFSGY